MGYTRGVEGRSRRALRATRASGKDAEPSPIAALPQARAVPDGGRTQSTTLNHIGRLGVSSHGIADEIYLEGDRHIRDTLGRWASGCRRIGVIDDTETLLQLTEFQAWKRGGAETFVSSCWLDVQSTKGLRVRRGVICKAYAGMGFGVAPSERTRVWNDVARALRDAGVGVPAVFGVHRAALYCEFVELSLIELLAQREAAVASKVALELANLVLALNKVTVAPVSLLPDLRTDGRRVLVTDFGEDIGPVPGTAVDTSACSRLLARELNRFGFLTTERLFAEAAGLRRDSGENAGDHQT